MEYEHILVTQLLGRLILENHNFKSSMNYTAGSGVGKEEEGGAQLKGTREKPQTKSKISMKTERKNRIKRYILKKQ